MASKENKAAKPPVPAPPPRQATAIIHGDPVVQRWLAHYWQKLRLPARELSLLALTQDRQEFTRWTGKRLNSMALGCYCYLSAPTYKMFPARRARSLPAEPLPGLEQSAPAPQLGHRHLIFIESGLQPRALEVTVAHELIHLADRVNGTARRHRHHGYDSIAADEAAITGYDLEELRRLLYEESARRETQRRVHRPLRYLYLCPHCGKQYPRVRRYSHPVSCSQCDKTYNPRYRLVLEE